MEKNIYLLDGKYPEAVRGGEGVTGGWHTSAERLDEIIAENGWVFIFRSGTGVADFGGQLQSYRLLPNEDGRYELTFEHNDRHIIWQMEVRFPNGRAFGNPVAYDF